jgi:hypothetical protein
MRREHPYRKVRSVGMVPAPTPRASLGGGLPRPIVYLELGVDSSEYNGSFYLLSDSEVGISAFVAPDVSADPIPTGIVNLLYAVGPNDGVNPTEEFVAGNTLFAALTLDNTGQAVATPNFPVPTYPNVTWFRAYYPGDINYFSGISDVAGFTSGGPSD